MKFIVMAGTRPEAVKLAPVAIALKKQAGHRIVLCASGQHTELVDQMFAAFGLAPDAHLPPPPHNAGLSRLTAHLLASATAFLEEQEPDCIIVQGDTTTVLSAALAASYRKITVAHVEAGLRSHDPMNPFPEETNRKLVAQLANIHFAPTITAKMNLEKEGVPTDSIHITGNTVVDAIEMVRPQLSSCALPSCLSHKSVVGKQMVLVTCHRRENHGVPLRSVCRAVMTLAKTFPEYTFAWPVHPNPVVSRTIADSCADRPDNLVLCEPLPYMSLLGILARCRLVLTDSGGLQEEAPSFACPVLVLRGKTERPEGVEAGIARLVGTDTDRIVAEATAVLSGQAADIAHIPNPYGDGHAAERIAAYLTA